MPRSGARAEQEIATFTKEVCAALGEELVCLALHGSAAGDEWVAGRSDVNTALIVPRMTFAVLERLAPVVARWRQRATTGARRSRTANVTRGTISAVLTSERPATHSSPAALPWRTRQTSSSPSAAHTSFVKVAISCSARPPGRGMSVSDSDGRAGPQALTAPRPPATPARDGGLRGDQRGGRLPHRLHASGRRRLTAGAGGWARLLSRGRAGARRARGRGGRRHGDGAPRGRGARGRPRARGARRGARGARARRGGGSAPPPRRRGGRARATPHDAGSARHCRRGRRARRTCGGRR